jgi:hypothetical protein
MHPQITTPLRLQDLDNKSSSLQRTTLSLSSRQTANLVPYNALHISLNADNRGSKLTPKCIPESAQLWALATEDAHLIPWKSLHCRQQEQRADKRMHHHQRTTPFSERERERAREIGITTCNQIHCIQQRHPWIYRLVVRLPQTVMTFRRPLIHFLFIDGGILRTKEKEGLLSLSSTFSRVLKDASWYVTH